jgi:NAD(P)-dependent dehydrogenase (short-subunit alcohol dehydrogenase family)
MGRCDGQVAIVTGAGGGIGKEHALLLAAEGAKVVVNDLGVPPDGDSVSAGPAEVVVREITERGGVAVANTDDISDFDGARRLVDQAVTEFGKLDILVNNAGILRDRVIVNMTEAEWDAVIRVHLKGTFAATHHAAVHWRARSKAGEDVDASVVNTTSSTGVYGNPGQANYGAAKAGIVAFSLIASMEFQRYGVRVNVISPTALTRMTKGLANVEKINETRDLNPANVSPLVVWLASTASRGITGRVFAASGGRITVLEGWVAGPMEEKPGAWSQAELDSLVPRLVARAAENARQDGTRPEKAAHIG